MNQNESCTPGDAVDAVMVSQQGIGESIGAPKFTYHFECVGPDGKVKWVDGFENTVTTVGKNDILDKYFSGSAYTAAVYLGLIGAASYVSPPVVGDTQASHATWTEAGAANAPTYTAPRKTITFNAASSGSKSPAAAYSFAITGTGTVKGGFINVGGSATIDNTTGVLYSAGLFSGGDRVVANLDTLNVSVTVSMT